MKSYQFSAIMSVLFFIWADVGRDGTWPHRGTILLRFVGGCYFAYKFGGDMRRAMRKLDQESARLDAIAAQRANLITKDGSLNRERLS